ncbi:MAG: dockerin type I domain-containing protein, partial [Myxococcota bacterium]|nr:dockerin type I domain-containing protein [Myxococcota bacterium]
MRLLQSSYPQRNPILAFILCALCGCGLHPDEHFPTETQSITTEKSSIRSACKTPGDLNNDQSVNIHDVIKLVGCIVHGECFSTIKGCSNDINADGSIDVTDMIDLIALIQNEDEASAEEPFPEEQWPNGPACEGECEPNGGGEGEGEGEEGTLLARSEPVPQGIAIRIDDDDYGFGALESVGVELLNGVNLMENISNPVYTGSASCWDLDASITGINFITTGLDIDPQSNGQIKISGGIYGLHVGWRLWADGDHWICGNHGFSGSAGALTTVLT